MYSFYFGTTKYKFLDIMYLPKAELSQDLLDKILVLTINDKVHPRSLSDLNLLVRICIQSCY